MRASNCLTKLYVNINVEVDGQKKAFTILDDILKTILGDFDHKAVDTEDITQLLFLENISITYNIRNVVTNMEVTSLLETEFFMTMDSLKFS